jgi:hypothetical protein
MDNLKVKNIDGKYIKGTYTIINSLLFEMVFWCDNGFSEQGAHLYFSISSSGEAALPFP